MRHWKRFFLGAAVAVMVFALPQEEGPRFAQRYVWNQWAESLSAQIPLQGDSTKYITSAASTNITLVSANPTRARQYSLINTTAVIYYMRVFNVGAAPALCTSTTGLVEVIPIPASASGAGIQRVESDDGQNFPAGMSFCLSAAVDGSSNAATGVFLAVKFKSS